MSGMNKETLAGFADVVMDNDDIDVIDSFNKTDEQKIDVNESFKSNESHDTETNVGVEDSFKDNSKKVDLKDSHNTTDKSTHLDADVDITDSFKADHSTDNSKHVDVDVADSFNTDNSKHLDVDVADSFNTDKSVNDSHNTDVDLDFNIDNSRQVMADDGAVAAGGDIDGPINTGALKGVQADGPVHVMDSAIGDGNISLDNIEGNVALGGNVTDIDGAGGLGGGPINVGGTQFNTTALGGDANTIVGNDNEVTGDQTANIAGTDGPSNVNFGDNVGQKAVETNDNDVDHSTNLDVDITDSFKTDDDTLTSTTSTDDHSTDVAIENSFTQDNDESLDLDANFDIDDIDISDIEHAGIDVEA